MALLLAAPLFLVATPPAEAIGKDVRKALAEWVRCWVGVVRACFVSCNALNQLPGHPRSHRSKARKQRMKENAEKLKGK